MGQKVVVGVGTGGAMGAMAALQGMSFEEFLAWAGTSAGAAALVWGIITLLEKFWRRPLSSNFKFYFAQALGVTVPFATLGVSVLLGLMAWSIEALFATALVAYSVSQTIHWEGDQTKEQEEEARAEEVRRMRRIAGGAGSAGGQDELHVE